MKNAKQKERKIHVALPDDMHQKLRVKCALQDMTIQEYLSRLIARDVQDVELPVKATNVKRESRYA